MMDGSMLCPLRMMRSFERPVRYTRSSSSMYPRSPVMSHPSSVRVPLFCTESLYPGNMFGPLSITTPVSFSPQNSPGEPSWFSLATLICSWGRRIPTEPIFALPNAGVMATIEPASVMPYIWDT